MLKKFGMIVALATCAVVMGACTQTATPKKPTTQSSAVKKEDLKPVAQAPVQKPQMAVPSVRIEHDALMKRTGKTVSVKEMVDCLDPDKKECAHSFHKSADWQYYAGLMNRRFGLKFVSFDDWKSTMLSADVTVIPCTAEIVSTHAMGRVHMRTGVITEDFERSQCYNPEAMIAYKGQPFVSTACANGLVPRAPQPKPECVGQNCPKKS